MEDQLTLDARYSEKKYLLTINQYITLSILTFNLYNVWWTYKAWKVFKAREDYSIQAALRTVLSLFFLIGLFNRINRFAESVNYEKNYSSVGLFIGILLVNLAGYLPEPYWLISLFSFIFFIPPFMALNYATEASDDYDVEFQESFNGRQIALILCGSLLWFLIIIGLLLA